jgi:diaminopimelate epimerase
MDMLEFAKLHGLGNDFLVARAPETDGTSLAVKARAICDRHRGVGADGILFYSPTVNDPNAAFSTIIINADGSRAEMSGNGVRCLAAFLLHSGGHPGRQVRIRTVSGIRTLELISRRNNTYVFEASMGLPITDPVGISPRFAGVPGPILDHPCPVGSEVVRVSLTSMGNPHCSTFWEDVAAAPVDSLGPLLERHEWFPKRANVEFIEIVDRHRIKVRFWERGVGVTLASGTGSSAAAVAAILNGHAESPVTVETELGVLSVRWEAPGELLLTGPAEFICTGIYTDPEMEHGAEG